VVTATYTDRDIKVGDLKLHYQEWGSPGNPAVLMLHGFGVSGHMFDEFAERVQDRYRLIALDQRGHGDSDWSEAGDYSREAFVADVEGFRQALGLDHFVLVGHSMGGLNAVSYTVTHPGRVSSLILVDVGPEAAKEGVDNIVRFTRGPDELEFEQFVELAHRFNQRRTIENIRERMRHRLKPAGDGKWTWKFDSRFRKEDNGLRIGSQLSNDETWKLYRDVPVPTLLVRGEESDVLTQEVAERCVREMQRARLVLVKGAGHSVPGDSPDDFTAAVTTFLDDVVRGAFGPEVKASLPLDELVEVQAEAERRRRGGSLLALALVTAGGLLAVAGISFALRQKGRRTSSEEPAGEAAQPGPTHLDIAAARARALGLATELSHVGRRGAGRARVMLSEVDAERARASALEILHLLSDRSRSAPARATGALQHLPVRRRRRSARARLLRRAARIALPMIAAAARKQGSRRYTRRRLVRWVP
jgi:pimeloyl-ACP methyl ester carboxylesterase